jgi:hypothetical protein
MPQLKVFNPVAVSVQVTVKPARACAISMACASASIGI